MLIKNGPVQFDTPVQSTPAELQVGRNGPPPFAAPRTEDDQRLLRFAYCRKREIITVPAGRFDCFRIEGEGWNTTNGAQLEQCRSGSCRDQCRRSSANSSPATSSDGSARAKERTGLAAPAGHGLTFEPLVLPARGATRVASCQPVC
jgi:hypothetical protein